MSAAVLEHPNTDILAELFEDIEVIEVGDIDAIDCPNCEIEMDAQANSAYSVIHTCHSCGYSEER